MTFIEQVQLLLQLIGLGSIAWGLIVLLDRWQERKRRMLTLPRKYPYEKDTLTYNEVEHKQKPKMERLNAEETSESNRADRDRD